LGFNSHGGGGSEEIMDESTDSFGGSFGGFPRRYTGNGHASFQFQVTDPLQQLHETVNEESP
jgi:hypothetical protein